MRPRRNNLPHRATLASFGCEALEERRMLSVTLGNSSLEFPSSSFYPYFPYPFSSELTAQDFQVASSQQNGRGSVLFSPDRILVTFSGDADTTDGAAGLHSITNPANWQLFRDGKDANSLLTSIDFSSSHVATLHLSSPLGPGHYLVIARDSIQQASTGHALDGDQNLTPGGNLFEFFSVSTVVATTPEESIGGANSSSVAVATDAVGNYVVVWNRAATLSELYDYTPDGKPVGLVAQRFDANGVAIGGLIQISSVDANTYSVAMNAAGDFAVTWTAPSPGNLNGVVFAQRFRADGSKATGALQVSPRPPYQDYLYLVDPKPTDIGIDGAGNFVVVWTAAKNSQSVASVNVARYSSTGMLLGTALIGRGDGGSAHVAMNAAGQFAVSWVSQYIIPEQTGSSEYASYQRIFLQLFRADGKALGDPQQVDDGGVNRATDVAMDAAGNIVVVWENTSPDGNQILAKRFGSNAAAIGTSIEVSTIDDSIGWETGASNTLPTVSMDAAGNFTVTWLQRQQTIFYPKGPTWDYFIVNPTNLIGTKDFIRVGPTVRVFDAAGNALSEAFNLSSVLSNSNTSQVIVTEQGNLIAVWTEPQPLSAIAITDVYPPNLSPLAASSLVKARLLSLRHELDVDLNGDASGRNTMRILPVAGGQNISLVDSGLTIRTFGVSQIASASITVENALAGDSLVANTDGTNLVANFANGVLTISGNDTLAAYQAVLRTVTFSTTAVRAAGTNVHIKFSVTGGSLTSEPAEAILSVYQPGLSSIRGRYVFYNNSAFDGHDAGINAGDDGAIAVDKTALTPNHSATFANYTSYSRGINGIIIDLDGAHGTISANDFQFKVGNDSSPHSWKYAPAPLAVSVRAGAGVNGSDRIEIVWADYSILNTWLEVSVAANGNTGLAQSDSFYFGNAVGETGNMTADARVNALDYVQTLNYLLTHPSASVGIDNRFDFNRDGAINAQDFLVDLQQVLIPRQLLELVGPGAPSVPPSWAVIVTTIRNNGYLPILTTGDANLTSGITSGFSSFQPPSQPPGAPDASDVPALLDAYWSQHTGDDEDDDGLELINV